MGEFSTEVSTSNFFARGKCHKRSKQIHSSYVLGDTLNQANIVKVLSQAFSAIGMLLKNNFREGRPNVDKSFFVVVYVSVVT